jgi:hypothetical protein
MRDVRAQVNVYTSLFVVLVAADFVLLAFHVAIFFHSITIKRWISSFRARTSSQIR